MGLRGRPKAFCKQCGERYIQKAGLCRQCEHLAGIDNRSLFEQQQQQVLAQQQQVPDYVPPLPVRVIDGQEFEVVWDGTA